MSRSNGLKQYWRGYRAAGDDIYFCGYEYACKKWAFGLNGRSGGYCNGYRDRLKKTAARAREKAAENAKS